MTKIDLSHIIHTHTTQVKELICSSPWKSQHIRNMNANTTSYRDIAHKTPTSYTPQNNTPPQYNAHRHIAYRIYPKTHFKKNYMQELKKSKTPQI